MKTIVTFELADYMAIAKIAVDKAPTEPATYEVEYSDGEHTLYVTVDHTFDLEESAGDYCAAPYTELKNESYDVISYESVDADGEPTKGDFDAERLLSILN